MNINANFLELQNSYLFSTIAKKVNEYKTANPDADIIRLGIGDVTLPLCKEVVSAMEKATLEMGVKETFRGYGEEQGYAFLRDAICGYYKEKGVDIRNDEVFVSDGAKSDVGNVLNIFSADNTVLIPDPVYPVYVDTNIMDGRKIVFMDGGEENDFLPMPTDDLKGDIIYLCSPNNPTGATYSYDQLKVWVDYANKNDAVILYDAAYECFVTEDKPASIFEIEGAKTCAIEFCSFSKIAGFTGTRCGYTVISKELVRNETSLNALWLRRQTTKFNGVPYIVQRGAEAVFTKEGQAQIKENLAYYKENAKIMADTFTELGVKFYGGTNSPYIWLKCPEGMTSWEYFDYLLEKANVVGTPGAGFGKSGEGYFRLTAFGDKDSTVEAMKRIKNL